MEAIITVVGFLGAGKTTLLKHLTTKSIETGLNPFVILNDYENAGLDAQQFVDQMEPKWVRALSGSCICCSGINELRNFVNAIPHRTGGITLIEANGTSDACSLMGFLGVGIDDRFLPPIQISVVDVKNWQRRGEHNELEANQVQVSSLIVLSHTEGASKERQTMVVKDLKRFNPFAKIIEKDEIDVTLLSRLTPTSHEPERLDHLKAHWSSCSVDLPLFPDMESIHDICSVLPSNILRVKGCVKVDGHNGFTYFERTPSRVVSVRPFYGTPTTGTKLLAVGPGSDTDILEAAIANSLKNAELRIAN